MQCYRSISGEIWSKHAITSSQEKDLIPVLLPVNRIYILPLRHLTGFLIVTYRTGSANLQGKKVD
ncbi:hypothetical protein CKK33_01905 [Mucilaginibacter sp. MD40]|nr:hypothetical protein CKK33_01905 [Mucilaginibacter sp. MD40]